MTPQAPRGYRRGTNGYTRITTALFAAGMATFISMYSAQAVLPQLAREFDVSPATSALAVSATTGVLAFAIVPASILSERFGRIRVMAASALVSALIGLLIPLAHDLGVVLAGRALQGLTLAGVPAVAMAYLAEEVDGRDLGAAMGRYIAGTTIGGLSGRLVAGLALDVVSWRWAMEAAAVVALVFTAVFVRLAPPSRFFAAKPIGVRASMHNVATHLRNARVMALVAIAFLLMGGFVSLYNILGFRLLDEPFALPQALVSVVFVMYLSGTVTSAWAGRLADRFGRGRVLLASIAFMLVGLALAWVDWLPGVFVGMLVFTGAFFAAHSSASGWVSAMADEHRAEASSLYLFGYYTGSSVVGALVGLPFSRSGWAGASLFVGALVVLAALIAAWLVAVTRRTQAAAAPGGS
nr:MFS transporter [Dermacoccus nishinomiyaensis]